MNLANTEDLNKYLNLEKLTNEDFKNLNKLKTFEQNRLATFEAAKARAFEDVKKFHSLFAKEKKLVVMLQIMKQHKKINKCVLQVMHMMTLVLH